MVYGFIFSPVVVSSASIGESAIACSAVPWVQSRSLSAASFSMVFGVSASESSIVILIRRADVYIPSKMKRTAIANLYGVMLLLDCANIAIWHVAQVIESIVDKVDVAI